MIVRGRMSERLGRYQMVRLLASGGMGEIYLAEHTGLSGFAKRVAFKRIRAELARDPAYVELFLNEARIGSFLNHPNIVHIFDVGHEKDTLWLVMEYVDGVDLKRLIRRAKLAGHPLSPTALAAVGVEVLSALEEAHAGGPFRQEPIIHRDLSPENVLVARSGAVKVLDYGLAKWMPGAKAVPSMEGNMIFGKIRYMPPEQLKGELIDVRADLFALGNVLYEGLTGAAPFTADTANAVLARVLAGSPPPPTRGKEPALDAIILKALSADPDRRFETATAMRNELVGFLTASGAGMPLEGLRGQLARGSPLARSSSESGPTPPGVRREDRESPTEIDLAVARRCGKCGGNFTALFYEGMIIDRCSSCRGIWLDHGEVQRILGSHASTTPHSEPRFASRAPLDQIVGSCPLCKVGLRAYSVPGQPAAFEVCPHCLGVWLDRGEHVLLWQEDVAQWFKTLLDSLRHLKEPKPQAL